MRIIFQVLKNSILHYSMEIYNQLADISEQVTHSLNDAVEDSYMQAAEIIIRYSHETGQQLNDVIEYLRQRIQANENALMMIWFENVVTTIQLMHTTQLMHKLRMA